MNDVEKAMAKREYKRERKKFTDGLCLKRLKEQNKNFYPEEFSGCLTLGLRTMVDVQNCRLEVNHTFFRQRDSGVACCQRGQPMRDQLSLYVKRSA